MRDSLPVLLSWLRFLSSVAYPLLWLMLVAGGIRTLVRWRRLVRASREEAIDQQSVASWQRFLAGRGISDGGAEDTDAITVLIGNLRRIQAQTAAGMGWGTLVGCAVSGPLAFTLISGGQTEGRAIAIFLLACFLTFGIVSLCSVVGNMLGYMSGIAKLEPTTGGTTAYNSRLTVRLSDFRWPALGFAPLALIVGIAILTFAAYLGITAPYMVWQSTSDDPLGPLVLFAMPCLAISVFLITEGLASWAVARPQRLFSWQATISREIDHHERMTTIGNLYAGEVNQIGLLVVGQCMLLTLPYLFETGSLGVLIWLALYFVPSLVFTYTVKRIQQLRGQLGGRLTGWPRRGEAGMVRAHPMRP